MKPPKKHHAYSEIFPLRDDQSLIELSDSIKKVGLLEPIVLLDDQVLAGRRRQLGCIRAGVTPTYRKFGSRVEDGPDPLEFAFSDYYRRNLSQAERAISAANYAKLKQGDNQHTREKEVKTKVATSPGQKEAAKKFGVNVKQVQRAKVVLENGVPELQEAMRNEKVSVSDAAKIASEPPDVQRKALKAVEKGEAQTLHAAVNQESHASEGNGKLSHAEKIARDLQKIIVRLDDLVTRRTDVRDLASSGLKNALALVRKL